MQIIISFHIINLGLLLQVILYAKMDSNVKDSQNMFPLNRTGLSLDLYHPRRVKRVLFNIYMMFWFVCVKLNFSLVFLRSLNPPVSEQT